MFTVSMDGNGAFTDWRQLWQLVPIKILLAFNENVPQGLKC